MNLALNRIILITAILIVIALFLPGMAQACPNCKKGLGANQMAFAYGISILLMMGMPFSLLAGWGFIFARTRKSD